jgi:hypothetical protein
MFRKGHFPSLIIAAPTGHADLTVCGAHEIHKRVASNWLTVNDCVYRFLT